MRSTAVDPCIYEEERRTWSNEEGGDECAYAPDPSLVGLKIERVEEERGTERESKELTPYM